MKENEIVIAKTDNGNTPIVFEDKETVKAITFDLLKETQTLQDAKGSLPKSRPIEHYQFIERLMYDIASFNFSAELEPIYVAKNDSSRIPVLDPNKVGAARSWLFQRLITRINITDFSNKDNHVSIGVGYNTFGINLAWGVNVRICQNMSIMGANYFMSSYGSAKESGIDGIFERFREWMRTSKEKYEDINRIFDVMKQREANLHTVANLVGEMQMAAVKKAYLDTATPAPLNISQVSEFSKNLLLDLKEKQGNGDDDPEFDLYTLYNIGTNILKPKNTDLVHIWKDNSEYSDFFLKTFELN
jgi:hypothetical protein